RFNNINYVRHVLRKVFGSHSKKYSSRRSTISDDNLTDQTLAIDNLMAPILIHPCLQYDKHETFSGELLLDWLLI
ncbi:unnamed protein product, partial [Rotaria socialis]